MSAGEAPKHYLPLIDGGRWVAFPSLALWCVMNYGDDILSAERATVLLVRENLDMMSGKQAGYSHVARVVQADLTRKLPPKRLCGDVATLVAMNVAKTGIPSLGRAIDLGLSVR